MNVHTVCKDDREIREKNGWTKQSKGRENKRKEGRWGRIKKGRREGKG